MREANRVEVVANNSNFSPTEALINKSIDNAMVEAERAGIRGKEVTPFLLAAIAKITEGKSLQTSMFSSLIFH